MTLDELGKVFLFIEVCVSKSVYIIISHYSLKITDLLMQTLTLLMCMKLTLPHTLVI